VTDSEPLLPSWTRDSSVWQEDSRVLSHILWNVFAASLVFYISPMARFCFTARWPVSFLVADHFRAIEVRADLKPSFADFRRQHFAVVPLDGCLARPSHYASCLYPSRGTLRGND
jgi:hypothetical protein